MPSTNPEDPPCAACGCSREAHEVDAGDGVFCRGDAGKSACDCAGYVDRFLTIDERALARIAKTPPMTDTGQGYACIYNCRNVVFSRADTHHDHCPWTVFNANPKIKALVASWDYTMTREREVIRRKEYAAERNRAIAEIERLKRNYDIP